MGWLSAVGLSLDSVNFSIVFVNFCTGTDDLHSFERMVCKLSSFLLGKRKLPVNDGGFSNDGVLSDWQLLLFFW